MKSSNIVLLFFCLVFILGPKTIWHGQAHHHESQKTFFKKKIGETNFQEDCYSCDVDLGLFTSAGSFLFRIPQKASFFSNTLPIAKVAIRYFQFKLLRGPPTRI